MSVLVPDYLAGQGLGPILGGLAGARLHKLLGLAP